MVIPEYSKSPGEILAPLTSSPNNLLWDIEEIKYCMLPCMYIDKYNARRDDEENLDLGERIVKEEIEFLRAYSDSSFIDSIGSVMTDLFWEKVKKFAGNNPQSLSADIMATFVVFQRTDVSVPKS